MQKITKVGLIGCGHIAETYFRAHKYFNNFRIIKCADINHKAAIKCARVNKITESPALPFLRAAGWTILCEGWKKEKNGRYTSKIVDLS